jgi:uracil-DNA glycosylase
MAMPPIHPDWTPVLSPETQKPYFRQLVARLNAADAQGPVYPPLDDRLRAFVLGPRETRVVILGQDPYHGPGQAHGLAFSVRPGVPVPPSLQNMFKEIEAEGGPSARGRSGDLTPWHTQGVQLLNASLTVPAGQANGHKDWGWATFTDAVIARLAQPDRPRAFLLWGAFARQKAGAIDRRTHLVLESPHPSPLSAHNGFFGNGHFNAVNAWLRTRGEAPIVW